MANLTGLDGLRLKMKDMHGDLLARAGKALYAEGLEIKAVSMERTPVLTGALRASHEVSEPENDGQSVKVVISVGGPSQPYAFRVHEDMEMNHSDPHTDPKTGKTYTCGGQSKFLESAAREAIDGMGGRLAERMQ